MKQVKVQGKRAGECVRLVSTGIIRRQRRNALVGACPAEPGVRKVLLVSLFFKQTHILALPDPEGV